MTFILRFMLCLLFCIYAPAHAAKNVLNIYAWSSEIPPETIEQFEKETGIKVNYSVFDNNEIMYTKLRTNAKGYDIAEPSTYYIERMRQQHMLQKLDKSKLTLYNNIDPFFLNRSYDPESAYSIPFAWGTTGIFYNADYYNGNEIKSWSDLSQPKFHNSLMFLDETRSVFSSALRMIGYSINDENPAHLYQAYLKLKHMRPNIRLFNNDAVISLLIDEDATIGMAYSGDVYAAQQENPKLQFVHPADGFEIWVDHFVLLKNAPHQENAYQFFNFLLRPDVARAISLNTHYSTTNLAAKNNLPEATKNNPILYPSYAILARGEIQCDNKNSAVLVEKYWEWLKMGV